MKASTPKIPIVVLVVAALLGIWFSNALARMRAEELAKAPHKVARAGFGKILSQINWMRLLQYRGSIEKVTPEDAARLAKRYDQLTNLDPLFAKAYEDGALDLTHQSPEEALRLLDKAMTVDKLTSWRIPFTAGFIARRQLNDPERALRYFEIATKRPEAPDYIERSLLYLKAEKVENDPLQVLYLWVEYYAGGPEFFSLDDEAARASGPERFVRGGAGGMMPPGDYGRSDRSFALGKISGLSAKIMDDASRELASETDAGKKKAIEERIAQTQKVVKRIFAGQRVCAHCFRPYNAGDRFCANDGKPLQVYGVCPKDGETIVRGAYCHKCGAKVN
jgi:tetratricopeptide (TPR) repeat protein